LKLKWKSSSKLKYHRNVKKPVTHKTVIETKLIFETEISLRTTTENISNRWYKIQKQM